MKKGMKKIVKRIIWCVVGILAMPVVLWLVMEGLFAVAPEFTEKKIAPVVMNLFMDYDDYLEEEEATDPIFEALSAKDYPRAIALCDSLQEVKPRFETIFLYFKSCAYMALGQEKAYEFWLKKTLESYHGGNNGVTAYLSGSLGYATRLRDKGDYEGSIKVILPALDVMEQHADDHFNLMIPKNKPVELNGIMASDLVALGKTDEAEKTFQTAINHYIKAAKFLDIEYETKTDTNYYYTAVELDLEAAKAYIKAMQYDRAQQWLEKTKQTISESEQYTDSLRKNRDAFLFDVHLMDALVLTHQGKAAEAERAYAVCLEKKRANDPSAINMRLQYLKAARRYQDIPALFHQFDSLLVQRDVAMNIDNISQILTPQYAAYRGMGQTAQALTMADSITQVLDSAIIAARNDNAAELATIYETQKKEAQISEQNSALSIMRLMWIIAILVVGIFIYVGYTILRRRSERRMAEMRAAQERIENELKIARDIQMSMVPSTFPEREGLDMYASMTPAKEVGGDLYGYVVHGSRLYFAVGDVSGKGVPASLFMAQATRLFMTLAKQDMMPAEICTRMNDALSGNDNESGMFVTMFLGLIDLETGHLDFCNAGHNPPIMQSDKREVISDKRETTTDHSSLITYHFLEMQPNAPIGLWPGLEYEGEEIESIKGRLLFIYTDGLNEAENTAQEQFGDDRLLDILRNTHFDNARQVIESLQAEVEQHRNGAEPNDDLTMMCLRVD